MLQQRTTRHLRGLAAAVLLASIVLTPSEARAEETGEQWQLDALSIDEAQKSSKGKGVIVGVVDAGIAPHDDVDSQVIDGHVVNGDSLEDTTDSHGTAMAGLIAATGDGEDTALGIAPESEVLPVKILMTVDSNRMSPRRVADGIRWAVDHGASVVNLSLESKEDKEPVRKAVKYAQDKDVVVVAATGNTYGEHRNWPAAYPGVVAVTAVDKDDQLWRDADGGSSFGSHVAVAAPGAELTCLVGKSPGQDPGYAACSGTSNATAIVSGTVALIRAKYPDLDAANVVNRLISTADQPGGGDKRTDEFGYGVINPVAALTEDVDEVDANPLGAIEGEKTTDESGDLLTSPTGMYLAIGGAALVVIVVAIALFVLLRRGKKRPPPAVYPGYPGGQ